MNFRKIVTQVYEVYLEDCEWNNGKKMTEKIRKHIRLSKKRICRDAEYGSEQKNQTGIFCLICFNAKICP